MLVSMNWICDYVDIKKEDREKYIQKFTLSTAEVEGIYYKGSDISGVVVGEVLTCEKHPDSKKLHILTVDAGGKVYPCVCGASNVRAGLKVAFALTGAKLPGGVVISKCKLAGYDSEGMCCAEDELGLADSSAGIMELEGNAKNGTDIKKLLPVDDIVFEVDNKSLTNRPDLWGVYGIAREFAALSNLPLKEIPTSPADCVNGKPVEVKIEREDLCYRYSCVKMSGITRKTSPLEVKIRLYYSGLRSINLAADLTNYILLELGQPTHAFDADKIQNITVKTLDIEKKFPTLDGIERTIEKDMLMICNGSEPVAIAGIMGGEGSSITSDTSSVLLEAANFDCISVRKTSSRLSLRTDSSMRFEKSLDPELIVLAAGRFIRLLKEADSGAYVSSPVTDKYVKRYPPVKLDFDKTYVDRYTGIDISADKIMSTLKSLGFKTEHKNGKFTVTVPSWRATKDISLKADIIEEISRIYGYDNFNISTTVCPIRPVRKSAFKSDDRNIKDILAQKYNLHEVHTYIWNDGKKLKKLNIDNPANVTVVNTQSSDNGTLRSTLLTSLLPVIYENRLEAESFGIFESGRAFEGIDEKGLCRERRKLGIALFDKKVTEKDLFMRAAEIVRYIIKILRNGEAQFTKTEPIFSWQHPKNTALISYGNKKLGVICALHPKNLAKIDKNSGIVCVEMDLDLFAGTCGKALNFSEPSKFPSIEPDLSLVIPAGAVYADIEKVWKSKNIKELASVKIIDFYDDGKQKSVTVRFTFSSSERTLSAEEVQSHINSIVKSLEQISVKLKT